MPRYFFNVHGETLAASDLVGRKLASDQAAKAEGRAVADELAKAQISSAQLPDNTWIEVCDNEQHPVAVIPVSESAAVPDPFTRSCCTHLPRMRAQPQAPSESQTYRTVADDGVRIHPLPTPTFSR